MNGEEFTEDIKKIAKSKGYKAVRSGNWIEFVKNDITRIKVYGMHI
jgi:hypothetical protein